jgi:hypothetical protein
VLAVDRVAGTVTANKGTVLVVGEFKRDAADLPAVSVETDSIAPLGDADAIADNTDTADNEVEENSALAVAEPERELRVEKWSRRGKDGRIHQYWQWTDRNSKATGKHGGQKWRSYGGSVAPDGALIESRRRRVKSE